MSKKVPIQADEIYRKEVHLEGSVIKDLQDLADLKKDHLKIYMEEVLTEHSKTNPKKKKK